MGKMIVKVTFNDTENYSAKEYNYLCRTEDNISPGDHAVVKVGKKFKVVRVTKTRGFNQYERSKASKWIVQKIDTAAYDELVKKEEVIQEIKNRMHERKEAMQDFMIYQQLAKSDPDMQKLIEELQEIDPSQVPALAENLVEEKKDEN